MSDPMKDTKTKDESKSTPDSNNSDNKCENLEYSKKIGDYILFDQIGMGTFSKVTRAFHLITQQTVAVKILDKGKIEDEIDIERIIREIEILKNIHHPNIAQMYETYSTVHNFYLMIEYVSGGDLFDYITSHNYLDEKKSCYFFRQIIAVLEYLIELGISHRDIKPENILLNEEHTQIKFIDFGLSNYCSNNELLHSSCGSPCYASPEMLSGHSYKGTTTDLWSAGIVLYSMLVGALPFDDQELSKLYEQIKIGKFYIPSTLSLEAIDLLKKILEVDPRKRISIEGVKNHAWFKLEENPLYKGINILIEHFPCDPKVVNYVIKNYFKEDKDITNNIFIKMVHEHECNKYTATYYLVKNNVLGIEEKFKIRKEKKKIENNNQNNKENKEENTNVNNKDTKEANKNIEEEKNKDKDKDKDKDKENDLNLNLDGLINKKKEEVNTRNKKSDIKSSMGNTEKNEDIFFFTGTLDDNQKLRSKTEEDINKFFSTNLTHNDEIKQNKKYSNDDDNLLDDILEKKLEGNNEEKLTIKIGAKNENSKSKSKQSNNSKKKSNNKESKKSNKKNNNEIRTGKIAIPILNIKKPNNDIKFDDKCITERHINNIKKNKKQTNSQNKNNNNIQYNNNIKNEKIIANGKNINVNQLNPSKYNIKKNKANSQESVNNNIYEMNNMMNKDGQNINEIYSHFSDDNKNVFNKIKTTFISNKNYKYAKSPSDINLLSTNNNIKNNNNNENDNDNNENAQTQNYKSNNINIANEFNEALLFNNRIKFRNSNKNQNKIECKTANYVNDKININLNNNEMYNNSVNKNLISYDHNMSNNNGYIININNPNSNQHNNFNMNQTKKSDKKKNLNIFANYIKQKNIYNIFNNDYPKNQSHQRNYKSALKYQLTELKTENKVVNNDFFISKKISVSRNKKSSYNKDFNSVTNTNTNFMSKNKNSNTIIKEYANKFLNNNLQKHSSSIDDVKNNFSISPKFIDKSKKTKDKKIYFINQNILNIDYLLKGKNKKNKLILTSTIGDNNNSPRNEYNIGQNYFGCAFHTEVNVKNKSNKNKENLSVVLKKGIIRNQKKNCKDIFSLRLKDKTKNNNNNSEQINAFNNSNNIYSNSRNINVHRKNKAF